MRSGAGFGSGTALLAVSAVALAAATVLLLRQNESLRHLVRRGTLLTVGGPAPPLVGAGPAGRMQSVEFARPAAPTLVFAYSGTCSECSLAWVRWRQLVQRAPRGGLRLVCIDVNAQSPASDMAAREMFPGAVVFKTLSASSALAYGLRYVPDTILVDGTGTVRAIEPGPLSAAAFAQLRTLLERADRFERRLK